MYKFGELKERMTGSLFRFIPDGTVISTITIGKSARPAAEAFTDEYSMGRINNSKYVPQTKDRKREWALATGGYKERTRKSIVEDAFEITVIDYATAIFDKLSMGLAEMPVDGEEQQPFVDAERFEEGWGQHTFIEEDGTVLGVLTIHIRLEIQAVPELKNEDGSPVWKVSHLADAGSLEGYISYPESA